LQVVLCEPFTIDATYTAISGWVNLDSMTLSMNPLPDGMTITGLIAHHCQTGDSLFLPGSGPVWSLTDSLFDQLGYTEGLLHPVDSCIRFSVLAEGDCRFRGATQLPDMTLFGTDICNAVVSATANFGQWQIIDTLQSGCTSCYTITKTALQDTVIAGDPVQFQVVISSFNADSSWVQFTEWLPQNFILTSTVPDSVFLPAIGSDTIIVEGYCLSPLNDWTD
jgi:hypothetical protein